MCSTALLFGEGREAYFAEAVILQPPSAQHPPWSEWLCVFAVTLLAFALAAQQAAPSLQQAAPALQQSGLLATLRAVTVVCAAPSAQ